MSRDTQLKERWEQLVNILSDQFSQGEDLDLDAIIYLIGIQELGKLHREFKKDEKLNLMHIAICRLLEPYGFYEFASLQGKRRTTAIKSRRTINLDERSHCELFHRKRSYRVI
jgi:hypothetical protein